MARSLKYDEPTSRVTSWVPQSVADDLRRIAAAEGITVSALTARLLIESRRAREAAVRAVAVGAVE